MGSLGISESPGSAPEGASSHSSSVGLYSQATFPLVTVHFSKTACPCPLLTLMPSVLTLWRLLSSSPHLCKCSRWLLSGPTVPGKPAFVFQFHTSQELVQDDGIQPDYTVTLLEWVQWTLRLLFWSKSSHLLWEKQQ